MSAQGSFTLEKVAALYVATEIGGKQIEPFDSLHHKILIHTSAGVLASFRELVRGTRMLGAPIVNKYFPAEQELGSRFPSSPEDWTPVHFQIAARNENQNTTGFYKQALYGGLLSFPQIAILRCLVKAQVITGFSKIYRQGGYFLPTQTFPVPIYVIIVDQAGFQWQNSLWNTGALFFFPAQASPDYLAFQKNMYRVFFGADRPEQPSPNSIDVVWRTYLDDGAWRDVSGKLDLDRLADGLELEFRQALDAVAAHGNICVEGTRINFKFLKAGMGHFASGIAKDNLVVIQALELARLKGIKQALQYIQSQAPALRAQILGKIGRLCLPFSQSADPRAQAELREIKGIVEDMGLIWGGAGDEDAFTPCEGFLLATTNCGDPHAMCGNEGAAKDVGHAPQSVDGNLYDNGDLYHMNAAINPHVQFVETPNYWRARVQDLSVAVRLGPNADPHAIMGNEVMLTDGSGRARAVDLSFPSRAAALAAPAQAVVSLSNDLMRMYYQVPALHEEPDGPETREAAFDRIVRRLIAFILVNTSAMEDGWKELLASTPTDPLLEIGIGSMKFPAIASVRRFLGVESGKLVLRDKSHSYALVTGDAFEKTVMSLYTRLRDNRPTLLVFAYVPIDLAEEKLEELRQVSLFTEPSAPAPVGAMVLTAMPAPIARSTAAAYAVSTPLLVASSQSMYTLIDLKVMLRSFLINYVQHAEWESLDQQTGRADYQMPGFLLGKPQGAPYHGNSSIMNDRYQIIYELFQRAGWPEIKIFSKQQAASLIPVAEASQRTVCLEFFNAIPEVLKQRLITENHVQVAGGAKLEFTYQ